MRSGRPSGRTVATGAGGLLVGVLLTVGAFLGVNLVINTDDEGDISITIPDSQFQIMAEVQGEVATPGTYPLDEGARLGELITAAGGTTPFADLDAINGARVLADGESVTVPRRCFNINAITAEEFQLFPGIGETTADRIVSHRRSVGAFATVNNLTDVSGIGATTLATIREQVCLVAGAAGEPEMAQTGGAPPTEAEGCFNINTITAEQFQMFPGIGETRASDIIAHRRSVGSFAAVDNLTDVSGIGATTLATIREQFCLVVGEGAGAPVSAPAQGENGAQPGAEGCFNINTITAEQFQTFPGIGETRANAIVAHRRDAGAFAAVDNLTDVSGIGATILSNILAEVCLVAE